MPTILLLETATNICSVGISRDGAMLVERTAADDYSHARQLTTMIADCAKEVGLELSDLDAVAISSGPGSFTSLRVGTATAKGLCYVLSKPLIAVDTLESLAKAMMQKPAAVLTLYIPAIDARRKEAYLAVYDPQGQVIEETHAKILDGDSFRQYRAEGYRICGAGNGAPKLVDILGNNWVVDSGLRCNASHLALLAEKALQQAQFVSLAYYEPYYLKSPNITQAKKKL